jgi:hypothetical protein
VQAATVKVADRLVATDTNGMAVITAAHQLADRFFDLIVPSDCVTDGNRRLHEAINGRGHAGAEPGDDVG